MSPPGYLIIASTDGDPSDREEAHIYTRRAEEIGYQVSLQSGRVRILTSKGTSLTDARPFGAIIGTVFDRNRSLCPKGLSTLGEEGALDDFLARLEGIWGSYIAIWDDPLEGSVSLIRDPSGSLPCYHRRMGTRWTLISSRADHICRVAGTKPDLHWSVIARMAQNSQLRTHQTAIEGIKELLPGQCLCLGSEDTRETWSPWRFTEPASRITTMEEATARISEAIDQIMGSWASKLDRVIIGLSGGLDSSIVTTSAARTPLQATCLTITSGTAIGDERCYAQASAAGLFPLIEESLRIEDVDIQRSGAAHCPLPLGRSLVQAIDAVNLRVASQVGATAFLHGGGGDNVFCHLQSIAPILDQLYVHGIGRSLASTLLDTCRAGDSDIWSAIALCVRRILSRRIGYRWSVDKRFLGNAIKAADVLATDHPWLRCPPHALPGSVSHIAHIMAVQNYVEGSELELVAPIIAPLLAQPLVELCLRIPSWMWVNGGINRAVARRAFENDLPAAIISRRSKGAPDGFAIQIFESNKPAIRAMLCEGELYKHGIVDKDAVLVALADHGPVRDTSYLRLLALCDVEAWINSWK